MNNIEIISSAIKSSITKSGILLFLAGLMIFMGIFTSEMYYKLAFNTRDNYISELAAPLPPNTPIEPSASIFNYTMMAAGLMIIIAAFYLQIVFKKLLTSTPTGLFGLGILGVGIFPGYIHPWHGIFALTLFIAGGFAAISSYRIVSSPLRYVFVFLGILSLGFLIGFKYFQPILGAGGTERWVFYPEVFWITGMGCYLLGIKDEYNRISHTKL